MPFRYFWATLYNVLTCCYLVPFKCDGTLKNAPFLKENVDDAMLKNTPFRRFLDTGA